MNTHNFEIWMKRKGICWNHLTTREKDETIAKFKAEMAPYYTK